MAVSLVHLSDLHFGSNKGANVQLGRVDSLIGAIDDAARLSAAVLIVVTGDVAQSGMESEYAHATDFFISLMAGLEKRNSGREIALVMVPGNHDCDLAEDRAIRTALLDSIREGKNLTEPEIHMQMLSPQAAFVRFANDICTIPVKNELAVTTEVSLGGVRIGIYQINSAWMSTIPEQTGALRFSTQVLPTDAFSNCDTVIALLHHPPSWFFGDDSLQLRRELAHRCDIVLTGHEHDGAARRETYAGAGELCWLEGELLQAQNDHKNSSFRVVEIDTNNKTAAIHLFQWIKDHYAETTVESLEFSRNPARASRLARLVPTFLSSFLSDIGMNLPLKAGARPHLNDLFVWPDFQTVDFAGMNPQALVRGEAVAQRLSGRTSILLFPDKGGRTSFCKKFFMEQFASGLMPVYVDALGRDFSASGSLAAAASESFKTQYLAPSADIYRQATPETRVLIIDNFHLQMDTTASELQRTLREAGSFAITVAVFTDESWQLRVFTTDDLMQQMEGTYGYIANEFTYPKRAELIRKWRLKYSGAVPDRVLAQTEGTISRILGTEFIPSYPGLVLLVLNAIDDPRANLESGAIGHLHHAMVVRCLQDAFAVDDVDTILGMLAALAVHLFDAERSSLSRSEFFTWCAAHEESYHLEHRDGERLLSALADAGMLLAEWDEIYFRYRYLFHFFAGYGLARESRDKRALVASLSERAGTADVSSILLFLCFFSTDRAVLDALVDAADACFADTPEFDLAQETIDVEASVRSPIASDHSHVAARARNASESSAPSSSYDGRKISAFSQEPTIEDTSPYTTATALIEIVGQALRNQAGSLLADRKLSLARSCFSLCHRFMTATTQAINRCRPQIEQAALDIVSTRTGRPRGNSDSESVDVAEIAERVIQIVRIAIATGAIRHVAECVGGKKLRRTLAALTDPAAPLGRRLCGAVISMDSEDEFPLAALKRLFADCTVPFAREVFRHLVWHHFVLYEEERALRQRVADHFGIAELRAAAPPGIGKT